MKKLIKGLAVIALSATMITGLNATKGVAATVLPDNYGAYVVASGPISGGDGYTAYYTKIGDGNAVMTFDLLSANTDGYFGFICGDTDTVKDYSTLDYVFTGKDLKTTFDLENSDLVFNAGYTYRATYTGGANKSLSVDRKSIGSVDGEYENLFKQEISTAKSNLIGIGAISDGLRSSTVIIDNFKIEDPYGESYVDIAFASDETVKDDGMKSFSINTLTGENNTVGSVYIHKDILLTVRFVDESGTLISTQKVCLYGSAQSPKAPEKDGYNFCNWSQSLDCIVSDMLIYPIYEVEVEKPDESIPVESIPDESILDESIPNETTSESKTDQTESQSKEPDTEDKISDNTNTKPKGGCKGSFAGGLVGLSMLGLGVLVIKRRDK